MLTVSSMFITGNVFFMFVYFILNVCYYILNLSKNIGLEDKVIFMATSISFLQFGTGFSMVLLSTYYQISNLNDFLRKSLEKLEMISVSDVFKKTLITYNKICDLCDSISSFYLVANMSLFMGFVLLNVFFSYTTYLYIRNPTNGLLLYLMTLIVWSLFYSLSIIWTTTLSSWIHSEGCKTADLVQQIVCKEDKLTSLKSSLIMSLQVKHRTPTINCTFDINWKILFSAIGTIFSLSIIMIQFYDVAKN